MSPEAASGGGGGGGAAAAPANGGGDGSEQDGKARRESALERLKKSLAAREIAMPKVEGYPFPKARKILFLSGIEESRLKTKHIEDERERGMVTGQRPAPGEPFDLSDEDAKVELRIADQTISRYLPQIYQRSDITGRNFVTSFLWIFQHIFAQTEEKLEGLERYFDPFECPSDFLSYIASWVALAIEDDWPDIKKRNIIKKAVELYHLRGTPRGLRVYLRIFTGVDPTIHENMWPFDGVVEGVTSTCGVDTILMHYVDRAHAFVVELPLPIKDVDAATIMKIHRIIEKEKPVHTDYYLIFKAPEEKEEDTGITVGITSTIGVDMFLKGADADAFFPMEDPGADPSGEPSE